IERISGSSILKTVEVIAGFTVVGAVSSPLFPCLIRRAADSFQVLVGGHPISAVIHRVGDSTVGVGVGPGPRRLGQGDARLGDVDGGGEGAVGEVVPALGDGRAVYELVVAGERGFEAGGGGAGVVA